MLELVEWFVRHAYAQIAGVALFMAALCVYAWWTRGRDTFLSELMVYLAAFVAFSVAQASVVEPIDRLVVRRAFAVLAVALWVHSLLMIRQIVMRLREGRDE